MILSILIHNNLFKRASLILPLFYLIYFNSSAQSGDAASVSLDSLLNIRISSASKYEQPTAEAPSSVTVLTSEDIRNFGWDHVGEALMAVRSLFVSDDRNYQYLGVWGFSRPTDYNNRVLVLIDGHTLNEPLWGTGPLALELQGLNIEMLERIEVLRGPSSSLYGNYAVQLIINMVFKQGKGSKLIQASVEQGSWGHYQASVGGGKRFTNGFDFSFGARANSYAGQNLYFAEYDDSTTNFGIAQKRDGRKGAGFFAQAAWKGLNLKSIYCSRLVNYPTGAFGTLFNTPGTNNVDNHGFVELSYSHAFKGKQLLSARIYNDRYNYTGNYAFDDTLDGNLTEYAKVNWYGSEVRLQMDLLSSNRLIVGAEANRYTHASYDLHYAISGQFLYLNKPFSTYSFFLQDEFQLSPKILLNGGLRFDQQIYENRALNPRIAILYHPTDKSTFKLSYAQAFRSPSVTELDVQDSTFVLGNVGLHPEKIRAVQLIWEHRISTNSWVTANLYHSRIADLIDPVIDSNGYYRYQNLSATAGTGIEGEYNFTLPGGTRFYSSAVYQIATQKGSGDELTNSPRIMLKAGITLPVLHHLRLSQDALFESSRITVYGTQSDPYLLLNSLLMFDPQWEGTTGIRKVLDHFRLSLRVRNLLNTQYGYPGGSEHLMPVILQNGRNYILKLQFAF